MKILHICTGNPFTPGMYYKENYLIDANVQDGHEVCVLADTTMWQAGQTVRMCAGTSFLPNGAKLIRLPVRHGVSRVLGEKIRKFRNFSKTVIGERPDVILFHAIQQHGVRELKKIRTALPGCKVYGDVSTSYRNSARNFLSRYVLHGMIYRRWLQKSIPYWDKIFYVVESSRDFLREVYGIPSALLELHALPGVIMSKEEKRRCRTAFRRRLGVAQDELVLFHSGKLDRRKKTAELLDALEQMGDGFRYKLFIAGSFYDDVRPKLCERIEQMERVCYLGFLDQAQMREALAACDLYLQPGSASQTAQSAICCGTPVVVSGEEEYRLFMDKNGYLIHSADELPAIFTEIAADPRILDAMSENAFAVAARYFDYKMLAARLYR